MAKPSNRRSHRPKKVPDGQPEILRGWQQISSFFGEPVSVVQRWARQGIPVRREGRFMVADSEALTDWLGKQSGKPIHIASDQSDLTAELKRGLSFLRKKAPKSVKIA